MATNCLFCKIAAHELESEIVHETDHTIAFKDINPAAPVHVLVIPKRHVTSSHEMGVGEGDLLGELFATMHAVAESAGIAEGYRVVTNIGGDAGQSVDHVHFHLLGNRTFSWPPG